MDSVNEIFNEAQSCKRCGYSKVYVPLFDEKNAKSNALIMFINERPGRIGTGKSGKVSFDNDDPTARQFKECFSLLGVPREKIFITNSCICHPNIDGYRDKAPKVSEIKNCQYFLRKEIKIMNPKIIVPLGNKALRALTYYYPESKKLKEFKLKNNIGQSVEIDDIIVFPLYHTSSLAQRTRNKEQQKKDWLKLKSIIAKFNLSAQ